MKDDGASFVFGALEHETRALTHQQFLKRIKYEPL